MQLKNKILSIFVVCMLFISVLTVTSSAEDVYNSSPISDTYRNLFEDIFLSVFENYPDAEYVYFRSGEYSYTMYISPYGQFTSGGPSSLLNNVSFDNSSEDGQYYIFTYTLTTRLSNYTTYNLTSSDGFVGSSFFDVNRNNGFIYTNADGSAGVSSSDVLESLRSLDISDRLLYILGVLFMFMLLYAAFQFIKKRWFIQ